MSSYVIFIIYRTCVSLSLLATYLFYHDFTIQAVYIYTFITTTTSTMYFINHVLLELLDYVLKFCKLMFQSYQADERKSPQEA